MKTLSIALCLVGFAFGMSYSQPNQTQKMKLLVHITQGAENPTVAALAFLVARTAIEEGHTVNLFLAGDGVPLMKDQVLDNLSGLGTGKLREHYDAIVKGGGKFYLSGMSSKGRGVTELDIQGKPAEFAMPNVLVRLTLESDKVLVY
ncbi:MAG TPA: DsrE family protein [Cyclobacteriaceae bacterium]|nr:DsrE family protein [Cyclobacteriaceae bacterium]